MVCNTGVRLTPIVDGKVHTFETRGLYDGLSVLWDEETKTIWNHVTGVGMYGPHAGKKLPIANLFHTTVAAALEADSTTLVAISGRPIMRESGRWAALAEKVPVLMPLFKGTMAKVDERRPEMDIGIGVWADETNARYYPYEALLASGKVLFDRLGSRRMLVYFDPVARAPMAIFTDARQAAWKGNDLVLSTGEIVRRGSIYEASGRIRPTERPLQLFTRWYGWVLTFPKTSLYRPPGA